MRRRQKSSKLAFWKKYFNEVRKMVRIFWIYHFQQQTYSDDAWVASLKKLIREKAKQMFCRKGQCEAWLLDLLPAPVPIKTFQCNVSTLLQKSTNQNGLNSQMTFLANWIALISVMFKVMAGETYRIWPRKVVVVLVSGALCCNMRK